MASIDGRRVDRIVGGWPDASEAFQLRPLPSNGRPTPPGPGAAGVGSRQSLAATSLRATHVASLQRARAVRAPAARAGRRPTPRIAAEIASQEQNGSLSYNSVLAILDDAVTGGMTASKFAALQSFASELNAPGGVSVSAYVQQIADDVIDGNSANATWNGGASTATRLGDWPRGRARRRRTT